jgi:hypothetical protein
VLQLQAWRRDAPVSASQAHSRPQQLVDTRLPAFAAGTKYCDHILVESQGNKRLALAARSAAPANSFDNMRDGITCRPRGTKLGSGQRRIIPCTATPTLAGLFHKPSPPSDWPDES